MVHWNGACPIPMRFIGRMSAGAGRKGRPGTFATVDLPDDQISFRRGAVFENKIDGTLTLGPNLYNIQHVNEAYEELMKSPDPNFRINPKSGIEISSRTSSISLRL